MTRFIVRRLMIAVVIVFFVSLATFYLTRIMPGDPTRCGGFPTPECRAAERHALGLDKPYFPVSPDFSADQDWWLLALPAAGALTFAAWRIRRQHALMTHG
ncbi:MAG TPA: hypothetical protein VIH21_12285 [Dehalococcoidia bacterium]